MKEDNLEYLKGKVAGLKAGQISDELADRAQAVLDEYDRRVCCGINEACSDCLTPQQPQSKDWEERFQELKAVNYFLYLHGPVEIKSTGEKFSGSDAETEIISFIHTLLAEERSRIVRLVDELSNCKPCKGRGTIDCDQCEEDSHDCNACGGTGRYYSLPIDDIKALLDTKDVLG